MKDRDYGFFKLGIHGAISLILLIAISILAHVQPVIKTLLYGISLSSWLLCILALFIPIYNIITAYSEEKMKERVHEFNNKRGELF